MAVDGVDAASAFAKPALARAIEPDPALADAMRERRVLFQSLYRDLAPRFAASALPQ
jgi:hypothetical protein